VGPWTEAVKRSVITLKALTYAPTGGIVAAATTSLPERLGGIRNWDYRYCWIRDATFSLLAFIHLGYYEEAQAWRDWLIRAIAGSPGQTQIMYGVGGERWLPELIIDWLPGYQGSAPVRIGNAAFRQLQLDVFGETADAMYQALKAGMAPSPRTYQLRPVVLNYLASVWREPDEGIWEVRGGPRQFTHSKVMAWVAFDRAVKSAESFGLDGPLDEWRAVRDEISADVLSKAFDPELGSFVQAYGTKFLDASLLMIPAVGFLPVTDPRMEQTISAIERRLLRGGFVMRYDTELEDDGLPPGEGAFLPCSFWLVDVYVLQGRMADAERLFRRLIAVRNDLDLFSEEYDTRLKRQVGNFPQAFTHMALVNTAYNLTRIEKPVEQRGEHKRKKHNHEAVGKAAE
jgi:GH15 family glucan-1,4-alpha-glucosidase